MLDISGYTVREKIYDSRRTLIYRGFRQEDRQPVIFKTLKNKYPSTEEISRLTREYLLIKHLDCDGIVKTLSLEQSGNAPVMIVQDFEGEPLSHYTGNHRLTLKEVLEVGIALADILAGIHEQGVIHKDINPGNIIRNPLTNELRVIDFGISTRFSRENLGVINLNMLEGTLPYISPEQTGRMNRALDYRTDFYSFGVSLYFLLAGRLPFDSMDPLELVHCHIAKMPPPLHEIDSQIPKVLTDIVLKLMAKAAEDRYQSAQGIKADLEKCLKYLKRGCRPEFRIATADVSERFQIPEKLYGREDELKELMEAFQLIGRGKRNMIFFSGSPGIGKSVLINEIQKPVVEKRGYFITGKYDSYKRNIPYTAIIQAFQELLRQVLAESEAIVSRWKTEILEAVGLNGQLMVDVIGELELIIGKQPPVQELPPMESQNRFNEVFQSLVKVFAKKEHPLVLFLDDLQWVDSGSLQLLQVLLQDNDLNYFLLIGAYRDGEVDTQHPFILTLEKLRKQGFYWTDIKLGPIGEEHIAELLSETFQCDAGQTLDLSKLLLQKTGGNPFFLKEFLKTLYDRQLIEFNRNAKPGDRWEWDVSRIHQADITDNVVELMAEKVKRLPSHTWSALKIACCMGIKAKMDMLAPIYGKSKQETYEDLKEAVDEGVLILVEECLKFAHDRVWEASYMLIDEAERQRLHYVIGSNMLKEADRSVQSQEDLVFNIAEQWNYAKSLLNREEQSRLTELNFKAGQKAKFSTAYEAAVKFFQQGTQLLPQNVWKEDYPLALRYHSAWSEAEYLARNVNRAEKLFRMVLDNARQPMEKVEIYSFQIDHYITQKQYNKALETGKKALRELGVTLPSKPGKMAVITELLKSKLLLGRKKVEDLINLPEMTDVQNLAALDIMIKCIPAAIIVEPIFAPIFSLKMVNLTLKYGNSPKSSYAFVMYGVILMNSVGDIVKGSQFGELAVKLADKFDVAIMQSRISFIYGFYISHGKYHMKRISKYFARVQKYSRTAGDFLFLCYAYFNYSYVLMLSGEHLNSVLSSHMEKYYSHIVKLNQPHTTDYFSLWYQALLNLSGESPDTLHLSGAIFDEEVVIPRFRETDDKTGIVQFYTIKQLLSYLMGEYWIALDFSEKAEPLMENFLGSLTNQYSYFIYALTLAQIIPETSNTDRKRYLNKLKFIKSKYRKWGKHNKYIYRHKYLLICAEINRVTKKNTGEIIKLYSSAIEMARQNESLCDEAFALEHTAKFFLSIKQERIASFYLGEAVYCYKRWGADPKVKQLKEKYPRILVDLSESRMNVSTHKETVSTSTTSNYGSLDLETVVKSSNTISREIDLEMVLKKMMRIVIENAGAQRGYFLLSRDNQWFIEAESTIEQDDVKTLQSVPIEASVNDSIGQKLPVNIINYVERTKAIVVLDDAANEGNFTGDIYIKTNKPKSVFCIPLINQGELTGILYLENNLTEGAFTPDRQHLLNMLSSQIAISIKNARMYNDLEELNKNLEQKVAERTVELHETNEKIMDSIRYSQRIQAAITPLEERLRKEMPDHFILLLPRDIVSGDFYWFAKVDNLTFLAVVDCTGHGVPGSLLAMMGSIFLNEIVVTNRIVDPAKILEELHKKVRTHLKQDEITAKTMDGMDVCLCRFTTDEQRFIFSGAKRPLYIVQADQSSGNAKLTDIRGDKKSIGGRQKETNRTYTNHYLNVQKGAMLYLTSDGFIDQPNIEMKRYTSRRLKSFLTGIYHLPVEQQRNRLLKELKKHQDGEKQGDDITVVGIRL